MISYHISIQNLRSDAQRSDSFLLTETASRRVLFSIIEKFIFDFLEIDEHLPFYQFYQFSIDRRGCGASFKWDSYLSTPGFLKSRIVSMVDMLVLEETRVDVRFYSRDGSIDLPEVRTALM